MGVASGQIANENGLADQGLHAQIKAPDAKSGSTSLSSAYHGDAGCLGPLIEAGADLEGKDREGRTAAMLAVEYGYGGLARLVEGILSYRKQAEQMRLAKARV